MKERGVHNLFLVYQVVVVNQVEFMVKTLHAQVNSRVMGWSHATLDHKGCFLSMFWPGDKKR